MRHVNIWTKPSKKPRKVFEREEIVEISSKTGSNVQELLQKIVARLSMPLSY